MIPGNTTRTYTNFNDIPYSEWRKGGPFKITDKDTIPAPLYSGQAVGIVNADETRFWWGWYLIGAIIVGTLLVAVYRLTLYDTFALLEATPEADIQDLANGDRIITAADGSTWQWDHITGAMTQIGGPDNKIVTILKYATIVIVIIIVLVIITKLPKFKQSMKGDKSNETQTQSQ